MHRTVLYQCCLHWSKSYLVGILLSRGHRRPPSPLMRCRAAGGEKANKREDGKAAHGLEG